MRINLSSTVRRNAVYRVIVSSFFVLLCGITTTALAVPVTVNSVAADWNNLQGAMEHEFFDTDGIAGNEEVRFGLAATDNGRSGYRFDSAAPSSFNVETGTAFSLGDFTHFNQPIFHSITGAQLDIALDLTIDGISVLEGPFSFSFLHDETTNACEPQPECANDVVSFVNPVFSDTFLVNGVNYTLELLGFAVNDVMTTEFSTVEGQSNVAQLIGVFTTAVPEPSPLALLALGLLAMSFARRPQKT